MRLDEPGLPLHDYHTIQVPKAEKGVRYRTRRDELRWSRRENLGTILSSRAYRMEAAVHIVLSRPSAAPAACPPLSAVASAMEYPTFAPYLGRRSCPLAVPLHPRLIEAPDFVSACQQALTDPTHLKWEELCSAASEPATDAKWFWEDGCHAPFSAQRSHHRHDRCTSHRNRLFAERIEHEAVLSATA
jgi:CRISPR system Cascade subunit CasD